VSDHQQRHRPHALAVLVRCRGKRLLQLLFRRERDGGAIEQKDAPLSERRLRGVDERLTDLSGKPLGDTQRHPTAGLRIRAGVGGERAFGDTLVVRQKIGPRVDQFFDRRFERRIGIHALIDEHPEDHTADIDRIASHRMQSVSVLQINELREPFKSDVELRIPVRIDRNFRFRCHATMTPFKRSQSHGANAVPNLRQFTILSTFI